MSNKADPVFFLPHELAPLSRSILHDVKLVKISFCRVFFLPLSLVCWDMVLVDPGRDLSSTYDCQACLPLSMLITNVSPTCFIGLWGLAETSRHSNGGRGASTTGEGINLALSIRGWELCPNRKSMTFLYRWGRYQIICKQTKGDKLRFLQGK